MICLKGFGLADCEMSQFGNTVIDYRPTLDQYSPVANLDNVKRTSPSEVYEAISLHII